jgi:choline dehydrogenase-like flavoprotein
VILPAAEITRDHEERADVCVVGSGAGGAVVAAEIAGAGLKVVVLEEGDAVGPEDLTGRPLEMFHRLYRDAGMTAALGPPHILLPMGRALGGSTVINGGTCFRTPGAVLASWARQGLSDYAPDRMSPVFEEIERFLGVAPVPEALLGPSALLARRGAEALGWSHGPLRRNAPGCQGRGECVFGCRVGAKSSMQISYVPLARRRGARFFTGARADRILVDGGQARGIVARLAGAPERRLTVRARAVVLAAGAVMSPLLLLRNRLALRSGQVGRNLKLHPATRVAGVFDREVRYWRGVLQGYGVDEFRDDGILLEEVSLPPGVVLPTFPGVGSDLVFLSEAWPRIALFGAMVADDTSGRVRAGPFGMPVVTYRLTPAGVARVGRAIGLLADLLFAAGAREVFAPVAGRGRVRSPREAAALAGSLRKEDLELVSLHPMGTCRMGVDPARSVVDARGECHEVRGLYVADASVLPSSLGVNPQITIMAVATKIARRLAIDLAG